MASHACNAALQYWRTHHACRHRAAQAQPWILIAVRCRTAALRDAALPDARRIALTAVHFPARCALSGDEHEEPDQASGLGRDAAALCPAGYDPAFLLPFCIQVLPTCQALLYKHLVVHLPL